LVGYVPRPTHECDAAVLVRRHIAEFLGRCEERAGPLPAFVKGELTGFAGCGDFELGFVRTCCRTCGDELRVPFSCKSRGCCPSCMGRRMAEGAALLVDHVLPAVGYRQWGLSFPGPMAVRLGYDAKLLAALAERLARAVMQDMRRSAKQQHGLASVATLHAGVVTVVQRFRSDLGLYVHLHCLVTDGVYEEQGGPRCRRRPRHRPRAGRLRAALARRPASRARLPARRAAADDRVGLRHESPRRDHRRRSRPQAARANLPLPPAPALRPRAPSLRSPTAASASPSRPPGAAAPPTPDMDAQQFLARLGALVPPPGFHMTRYYGVFASHHRLREHVIPRPQRTATSGQLRPTRDTGTRARPRSICIRSGGRHQGQKQRRPWTEPMAPDWHRMSPATRSSV